MSLANTQVQLGPNPSRAMPPPAKSSRRVFIGSLSLERRRIVAAKLANLGGRHERIARSGVEFVRDHVGISAAGAGRILRGVAGSERVPDQTEHGDEKGDDVVLRPLADRLAPVERRARLGEFGQDRRDRAL
jgi:hypothetical protein